MSRFGFRFEDVMVRGTCGECRDQEAFCLPLDFLIRTADSLIPLCKRCGDAWAERVAAADNAATKAREPEAVS